MKRRSEIALLGLVALCFASALSAACLLGSAAAAISPHDSDYVCKGATTEIFNNGNTDEVKNGGSPNSPSFSTDGKAYCLVELSSYHWNDGKGVPTGGDMWLTQSEGPTKVGGREVPAKTDAYPAPGGTTWYAEVPDADYPVVLDGTYTCHTDSPETWSYNSESDDEGFCFVSAMPYVPKTGGESVGTSGSSGGRAKLSLIAAWQNRDRPLLLPNEAGKSTKATFQIHVANIGSLAASNVVVSVHFSTKGMSPEIAFPSRGGDSALNSGVIGLTAPKGCVPAPPDFNCTVGGLGAQGKGLPAKAADFSFTFSFNYKADNSTWDKLADSLAGMSGTATATASDAPEVVSDASTLISFSGADFEIAVVAPSGIFDIPNEPGTPKLFAVTVNVSNLGPDTTGAHAVVTLTPSTLAGATTVASKDATKDIPSLAKGHTDSYEVTYTITPDRSHGPTAGPVKFQVLATVKGALPDPNPYNNKAKTSVRANVLKRS